MVRRLGMSLVRTKSVPSWRYDLLNNKRVLHNVHLSTSSSSIIPRQADTEQHLVRARNTARLDNS